ncbi:hypothetical protein ACFE04_029207 [Oxalis oulophora]
MVTKLIFLTLLLSLIAIINGDQALINKVCNNEVVEKDYCHLCFNSHPNTRQQDTHGLAGTSIYCTRQQANDLSGLFKKYDFVTCRHHLHNVAHSVHSAYKSWKKRRYGDVIRSLIEADENYLLCSNELRGKYVPKKVDAAMTRLDNFILNADAIVTSIGNTVVTL